MSCPHCRTDVKHGERISCCSGCGRLFTSGTAFEKHYTSTWCLDPADLGLVLRPINQKGVEAEGWSLPVAEGGSYWSQEGV